MVWKQSVFEDETTFSFGKKSMSIFVFRERNSNQAFVNHGGADYMWQVVVGFDDDGDQTKGYKLLFDDWSGALRFAKGLTKKYPKGISESDYEEYDKMKMNMIKKRRSD
jgi:hypothetical protein